MVAEAEPAPRQRDHGDRGCDEERLSILSEHERQLITGLTSETSIAQSSEPHTLLTSRARNRSTTVSTSNGSNTSVTVASALDVAPNISRAVLSCALSGAEEDAIEEPCSASQDLDPCQEPLRRYATARSA
jgi:hypothetical protein